MIRDERGFKAKLRTADQRLVSPVGKEADQPIRAGNPGLGRVRQIGQDLLRGIGAPLAGASSKTCAAV